jgi:hypothetical protein
MAAHAAIPAAREQSFPFLWVGAVHAFWAGEKRKDGALVEKGLAWRAELSMSHPSWALALAAIEGRWTTHRAPVLRSSNRVKAVAVATVSAAHRKMPSPRGLHLVRSGLAAARVNMHDEALKSI